MPINNNLVLRVAGFFSIFTLLLFSGCTSAPEGIEPVKPFSVDRYLGTWYEIARLDHSFERGLTGVTANYSLRQDGCLKVINRGVDAAGALQEAVGRGCFVGDRQTGHLKVSFFGPFYGAYVVIALDMDNYGYALVTGPNRDYLWVLAREPVLDRDIVEKLVAKARRLGFATDQLIYVEHQGI